MRNAVKAKLRRNQAALGTWNMIGHSAVIEILALAGYDWVAMDLEHGQFEISRLADYCQILERLGVAPICRLPVLQPEYFKWALDAGAQGVIVPWVRSVEDARLAAQYTRYPPRGARGVGITRAHEYGSNFEEYVSTANDEILLVLMIEHIDAVNAIDDILQVPDVDAILIGPYDLSGSMGLMGEIHHPALEEAVSSVLQSAKNHQISAGIHLVDPLPGDVDLRIKQGFTFIALGLDTVMLNQSARYFLKGKSLD
ncbi:MAG: hypothetical protein JW750_12580 [Anaerolineaceae bacterium]|nr:hypothetical protein [Anaerolineaceae bacterium]